MAVRWSSDFSISEFKDVEAKCMALDCTGNFLFLPGKKQMAVKNLNHAIDKISYIPRLSKHEPTAIAWNLHYSHRSICALSSGIQIDLLLWKNENELIVNDSLKSHTRVITGINWHPTDPNILASSSLDTSTFIWDIREVKKPAISLSSFAAASHVKWNKVSRHILATAHKGDVKIWDKRKTSAPLQYISAHMTSINSLDWSRQNENQLFTASQDNTIKFFDLSIPKKFEYVINTDAPVWKASYTPFGRGMLAVLIPNTRKNDHALLLWNLNDNAVPVHTFVGHTEIVLDFAWRYQRRDDFDYQLITWSKDRTLRIWEVDKYLHELYVPANDDIALDCVDGEANFRTSGPSMEDTSGALLTENDNSDLSAAKEDEPVKENTDPSSDSTNLKDSTSRDNVAAAVPGCSKNSDESGEASTSFNNPMNLQQEFSTKINIPNVRINKTDIVRRTCYATVQCNGTVISLLINFPPSYPRNRGPIFRFIQGTTISNASRFKVLEVLRSTAEIKVKNNEACLEACLRAMQQFVCGDGERSGSFSVDRMPDRLPTFSMNQDSHLLLKKTCGAKFCHIGQLVCFAKLSSSKKPLSKNICELVSLSYKQTEALTRLYLQNKNGALPPRTKYMIRRGLLEKMKNARFNKRNVFVYDVSGLFFFNLDLATKYYLNSTKLINEVCEHNANTANLAGRKDLQQVWNLAKLITANMTENSFHFNKKMLHSLICYYVSQGDIQTAATICCVFQQYLSSSEAKSSVKLIPPFQPIPNACNVADYSVELPLEISWSLPLKKQHTRSSSLSECVEDLRLCNVEEGDYAETYDISPQNSKNSQEEDSAQLMYNRIKLAYSDMLYRSRLLNSQAEVMKYAKTFDSNNVIGVQFLTACKQCKNPVAKKMCPACKLPTLFCAICRLSVKGLAVVCVKCGHGGHLFHMKEWHEFESRCACGCKCECTMDLYAFYAT